MLTFMGLIGRAKTADRPTAALAPPSQSPQPDRLVVSWESEVEAHEHHQAGDMPSDELDEPTADNEPSAGRVGTNWRKATAHRDATYASAAPRSPKTLSRMRPYATRGLMKRQRQAGRMTSRRLGGR
jgi:hypothetical protein